MGLGVPAWVRKLCANDPIAPAVPTSLAGENSKHVSDGEAGADEIITLRSLMLIEGGEAISSNIESVRT